MLPKKASTKTAPKTASCRTSHLKIDRQALVDALHAHALSRKGTMSSGQVSAALALLKLAADTQPARAEKRHEDFLKDLA